MYPNDPVVAAVSEEMARMIAGVELERTLVRFRQPRPVTTLKTWLEKELAVAHPAMKLNKACVLLLNDPEREELAGGLRHFQRVLSGEVAPHPSTIFWIGEKLRTTEGLQIESSSGLAALLASGRFFDAFGAAGVLYGFKNREDAYVWPALAALPGRPPRETLTIAKSIAEELPEVWREWVTKRRNLRALRPWRQLVERTEGISVDGLARLVESWPDVDFVRC